MNTSKIRNAIGRATQPLWKQAAPAAASMAAVERRLLKAFQTVTDDHVVIPPLQAPFTATTTFRTADTLAASAVPEIYSKFNVLSRRYHNVWDGMKDGGGEESSFVDIEQDVLAVLHNIKEAHGALVRLQTEDKHFPNETKKGSGVLVLPDRVIFCIAFSQTRNKRAVAAPMLRIIKEASEAVARHNRQATTGNKVLRVVPILVGLSCHEEEVKLYASQWGSNGTTLDTKDYIFYPKGGLYTFNACLQCLCSQIKNIFHSRPTGQGTDARAPPLQFRCFLLSEGWLHVRTIASLHHSVNTECVPEPLPQSSAAAAAAPGMLPVQGNPHNYVEVVPGVVHDCLAKDEIVAFANYIACRAVR